MITVILTARAGHFCRTFGSRQIDVGLAFGAGQGDWSALGGAVANRLFNEFGQERPKTVAEFAELIDRQLAPDTLPCVGEHAWIHIFLLEAREEILDLSSEMTALEGVPVVEFEGAKPPVSRVDHGLEIEPEGNAVT